MPSSVFTYASPLVLTPLAASGNSTAVSLPPKSQYMGVTFHIKFTLGSLTNATFTVQALNPDGATWQNLLTATGAAYSTGALAASANVALAVAAPGCKQLRVAYISSGTVTSSAVTIDCTTQAA